MRAECLTDTPSVVGEMIVGETSVGEMNATQWVAPPITNVDLSVSHELRLIVNS